MHESANRQAGQHDKHVIKTILPIHHQTLHLRCFTCLTGVLLTIELFYLFTTLMSFRLLLLLLFVLMLIVIATSVAALLYGNE